MSVTPASFRQNYPEFASTTTYPDSQVTYWTTVAVQLINADRWDTLADLGIELFVAHNLVIEARSQATSANGAAPGEPQGMVASKSVDKVSVSYDTSSVAELDAGHWNLTVYGARYIRLARMMGAGGIQLGYESSGTYSVAQGAWPGPYWPFGN